MSQFCWNVHTCTLNNSALSLFFSILLCLFFIKTNEVLGQKTVHHTFAGGPAVLISATWTDGNRQTILQIKKRIYVWYFETESLHYYYYDIWVGHFNTRSTPAQGHGVLWELDAQTILSHWLLLWRPLPLSSTHRRMFNVLIALLCKKTVFFFLLGCTLYA